MKFEKIACQDEGEFTAECKAGAEDDRDGFLETLLEPDKADALADCDAFQGECFASCEGDMLPE
jgi:hypothetical protein